MKKFFSLSSIMLVFILILSGCATIIHGGDQDITINTSPTGIKVKVIDLNSNAEVGNFISPCVINLDRGNNFFDRGRYSIEFEKEGHSKKIVYVNGSVDGWYIVGNFFIGGLLGWLIIDPATGAMWKLQPDRIYVSLQKTTALNDIEFGNGSLLLDKSKLTSVLENSLVTE